MYTSADGFQVVTEYRRFYVGCINQTRIGNRNAKDTFLNFSWLNEEFGRIAGSVAAPVLTIILCLVYVRFKKKQLRKRLEAQRVGKFLHNAQSPANGWNVSSSWNSWKSFTSQGELGPVNLNLKDRAYIFPAPRMSSVSREPEDEDRTLCDKCTREILHRCDLLSWSRHTCKTTFNSWWVCLHHLEELWRIKK